MILSQKKQYDADRETSLVFSIAEIAQGTKNS